MPHKILVVDDEPNVMKYLSMVLEASGYELCKATDGEMAIDQVRQHSPDLIVLDLWLPKMTGAQVLNHLNAKEQTSRIPVILMTADPNFKEAVGSVRVKEVLIKPFSTEALLEKIKSYCN